MALVSSRPENHREDIGPPALRRFAVAVVRDDRLVRDPWTAQNLADVLCKRALLATGMSGPTESGVNQTEFWRAELWSVSSATKVALFGRLVRFHRSHVRRMESEADSRDDAAPAPRPGDGQAKLIERVIRGLPLEQREALLIVVLGGLTHEEAAAALEIPLGALIARLGLARQHVDNGLRAARAQVASPPPARGRHLRLVK